MKKHIALFAALMAAVILFASCHKEEQPMCHVTVSVTNIDDLINTTPKNSEDMATSDEVQAVTLCLFSQRDNRLAYEHTQLKSDTSTFTTFGTFELLIEGGSYNMAVFAYRQGSGTTTAADVQSHTSVEFGTPSRVFLGNQTVTISESGNNSNNYGANLERVSAQLYVKATDDIPEGAHHLRFTFSQSGTAMNPFTGLATNNTGMYYDVTGLGDYIGTRKEPRANLLLYSDEQVMDVNIQLMDAEDNVMIGHQFENISFKRNQVTYLSGPIFHEGSTSGFTINTDWIPSTDTIYFK